jgi:GNAT superfamily N-acetyltransferase
MSASEHGSARWRVATTEDDEAIVEMVTRLYEEDPGEQPVPAEATRRTLRALRAEPVRGRAVVLEEGGVPRAYALLVAFWSNELGGETCEIDELYVTPALRGKGHASALLKSLAVGTGPWPRVPVALCLQVSPANARARALYTRLGFSGWSNAMMVARLANQNADQNGMSSSEPPPP